MRAQRIKTGFHRIGLTLAVVCGVPGVLLMGVGAYSFYDGNQHDAGIQAIYGVITLIFAAAGYAAARALGWIIAGFIGDNDQISN